MRWCRKKTIACTCTCTSGPTARTPRSVPAGCAITEKPSTRSMKRPWTPEPNPGCRYAHAVIRRARRGSTRRTSVWFFWRTGTAQHSTREINSWPLSPVGLPAGSLPGTPAMRSGHHLLPGNSVSLVRTIFSSGCVRPSPTGSPCRTMLPGNTSATSTSRLSNGHTGLMRNTWWWT